jgi:hypothetical protein
MTQRWIMHVSLRPATLRSGFNVICDLDSEYDHMLHKGLLILTAVALTRALPGIMELEISHGSLQFTPPHHL